jgi:WD40 repeat protein
MSPDQRQFASVGADGYLRLWSLDVTDRAMLNGPRPLLRSDAVVSPNGCWAVTESERSSEFLVHQWRDNRWHTVDRLARPKPWSETEFDISNDGQWVVQRRETNVYCWRRGVSDGWTHVGKHENLVDRLAIVPGKDILVTLFKCTLQAWQLSSSSLLWQVEMKTNNPAARLHATAELLCCAAGSVVSVHRVDSGDVVFYKNVPSGEFNDAVISPDGREVLAASTDRAIHRWTLSDGQELDRWVGHDDAVLALAVHPSGKTVASVDQRRVLKLWHSITGLPLLTSSIDLSRPRLNFADDGERLLICGRTEQAGLNVVTLFSHLPMRRTSNPAVSAPAR